MINNIFFVGLGGACGSIARYLTSVVTIKFYTGVFPLPTFIINILGCLIIGLLIGLSERTLLMNSDLKLLLITGFCGGYTTFSTFSAENLFLYNNGFYITLAFYIFSSIILGILAVYIGSTLVKI